MTVFIASNELDRYGFLATDRNTTAGNFNAEQADQCWAVNTTRSTQWTTPTGDNLWFAWNQKFNDNNNWDGFSHRWFRVGNSEVFYLDVSNGTHYIAIAQGTARGAKSWVAIPNASQLARLCIHFSTDTAIGVAAGGMRATLYYDGTYAGAIESSVNGGGVPNRIDWRLNDLGTQYISNLVIADRPVVTDLSSTIRPNAAGTQNGWGGAFGSLADRDDVTNINNPSIPANVVQTFGYGNPRPLGFPVLLRAGTRGRTTGASSQIGVVTRQAGVNYDGPAINLTNTLANYTSDMAVNPNGNAQWTLAAVNDAEFGYKT